MSSVFGRPELLNSPELHHVIAFRRADVYQADETHVLSSRHDRRHGEAQGTASLFASSRLTRACCEIGPDTPPELTKRLGVAAEQKNCDGLVLRLMRFENRQQCLTAIKRWQCSLSAGV